MRQNRDLQIEPELPLGKLPPSVQFPLPDPTQLKKAIEEASQTLLNLRHEEGYWWFTLEANEAIGAGFIQLMHFLGAVDADIQKGLIFRMFQEQHEDGSWGLYYSAQGDLSTTVECYLSLKLAGFSPLDTPLLKARKFILSKGGLTKIRIFTRIHLALFGLIGWDNAPSMPAEMILLPPWAPMNVYHFSSWARASIVPLLVVMNTKPVVKITGLTLEELYAESLPERKWKLPGKTNPVSLEQLFLLMDRGLKTLGSRMPIKPWRRQALDKCIDWIWEHIQKTEDIYPALAYGAMAFKAYGLANDSLQIQTALGALKRFQQTYYEPVLPCMPQNESPRVRTYERTVVPSYRRTTHQQCCISPVWDTPWTLVALLESGVVSSKDPGLLKAGRWLLSKEVRNSKGDWRFKNPEGSVGGWSFEFLNEYFPDVDDTIEVIAALEAMALPEAEKRPAIQRGLDWILSMQNDDGGWGAFDKNNDLELVNKIPFSDHGACLDPSSPDITGRALELFLKMGMDKESKPVKKAVGYLKKSQEKFGGWFGRWGVNYIYGTWCVLTGLSLLGRDNPLKKQCEKACHWLMSIQNEDGGFCESPESYLTKHYVPYPESVPSQTAWGLMGLVAGGHAESIAVQQGVQFLLDRFQNGVWEEKYSTGTGFPGHFYIRYHGYRYYFPLLALARYQNKNSPPL